MPRTSRCSTDPGLEISPSSENLKSSYSCCPEEHPAAARAAANSHPKPADNDASTGPEVWLQHAMAGDVTARHQMFTWVHECGRQYYLEKSVIEPLLSYHDAQDLATEALIEFEKSWQRVRSVEHYTRRMLKNNLQRFLKKRRRVLKRECVLELEQIEYHAADSVHHVPEFEFERFSDEDRRRYNTASEALEQAEPIVQMLFQYRVLNGSMTYGEISEIVGATETSLRMRMARFNRHVRERHRRQELSRALSAACA